VKNLIAYVSKTTILSIAGILLVSSVHGQEAEGERYRTSSKNPQNVYFGDAHVHTSMSLDAAAWGSSLAPDEVYRYARGEEAIPGSSRKSLGSAGTSCCRQVARRSAGL
jgi:hypothetical protein